MAEPASTSVVAIFSVTKAWSILASVCGSIIPVMALSDEHKIGIRNVIFMAVTGSSFAIFMGPWAAQYVGLTSIESLAGLSWTMGVIGVFLIKAVLRWLDRRGVDVIDRVFSKVTGIEGPDDDFEERIVIERKLPRKGSD
jgi:hypothetical protein